MSTLVRLPSAIEIPDTVKKISLYVEARASCQGMILFNGKEVCGIRHPLDGPVPVTNEAEIPVSQLTSPIVMTVLFVTYRGHKQGCEVKGHIAIGEKTYPFEYSEVGEVDQGVTHLQTSVLVW